MDRTSGEDVSSPLEQGELGDNDGNDDDPALNWVEPTPGSLRYTLQLRVERYIEILRAERSQGLYICIAALNPLFQCLMPVSYDGQQASWASSAVEGLVPVFDIFSLAPVDTVEKRVTRNLLLQEIDAIQSRMDHPQRPIWKYIIGLLV